MASKAVLLALLSCFVALSAAASFSFNPASPRSVSVGVWSDWIFVSTDTAPTAPLTLSLTADVAGSVDLSTTTLNFDSVRRTASFRFRALTTSSTSTITISFTTAGDGAVDFSIPSTFYVLSSLRQIDINEPSTNNGVQLPSEPKKITLNYPSTGDITLTPTATPPIITFTPSTIVIPAGSSSASYVYMVTEENYGPVLIEFAVSGAESAYYQSTYTFNSNYRGIKRSLASPSYSGNVLVGGQSGQLFMYVRDYVNQTFTVAPQAADTVFTPSTFDFSAGRQQTVNFTFFTSSPSSSKQIYYKLTGAGAAQYDEPSGTAINVPKGTVSVITPTEYFQGKITKLSLRVSSPLITDLTVKLFAANVQFNPAQVTFTATSGTSLEVGVTPMAYGVDSISFALSGTAADWYNTPAPRDIAVSRGTFVGPADWYLPSLIVGRQSDPLPVRMTVAPGTSVTLIPTSADLVFTPAQLVFTPDNVQQFLTIKPSLAQSAPTTSVVVSSQIDFIVTGEDATLFDAPASVGVNILRRNIQVVVSKHVFYPSTDTIPTMYLGKRYTLWASASYVDEPVTVTPVNPYMTFEPAQLQFSSGTTRVSFVATVTSALAGTGSSDITYVISGQAGGHYTNIAATTFYPRVRPLYFHSAMVAPDDRVVGTEVSLPSTAVLGSNHIWSVVVRSPALPEGTFTITPRAYHVKFTPASADMKAEGAQVTTWDQKKYIGSKEFSMPNQEIHVNFTMEALSSGIHEVWFELSGADGAFYAAPPHTRFSFFIEERASAELPSKISAAPQVVANAVLFVFVAIIAVLVL